MKKTLGLALALVAATLVLTAFRGGGCGGHGHGHGDPARVAAHVDDVLDDLDATPDQRTRIHAILDRTLAAGKALHEESEPAHAEALAQLRSDAPDAAKLHALVDGRIDALRAFAHQAVDATVEAHGVLTPEQRAKLSKKIERHHRDR